MTRISRAALLVAAIALAACGDDLPDDLKRRAETAHTRLDAAEASVARAELRLQEFLLGEVAETCTTPATVARLRARIARAADAVAGAQDDLDALEGMVAADDPASHDAVANRLDAVEAARALAGDAPAALARRIERISAFKAEREDRAQAATELRERIARNARSQDARIRALRESGSPDLTRAEEVYAPLRDAFLTAQPHYRTVQNAVSRLSRGAAVDCGAAVDAFAELGRIAEETDAMRDVVAARLDDLVQSTDHP